MDDLKPWWASRTIWASIIAVVAVIAGYFRYDIAPADQASLVDAITTGVGVVAGLIAIVTRIGATKQIGKP
jgi:hypothetical protein